MVAPLLSSKINMTKLASSKRLSNVEVIQIPSFFAQLQRHLKPPLRKKPSHQVVEGYYQKFPILIDVLSILESDEPTDHRLGGSVLSDDCRDGGDGRDGSRTLYK